MAKREEAGLPRYPELRWVTLTAMRGLPMPASNTDIDEAVADALGLTAFQRVLMHVNGRQTELGYRVAWARTALNVAGAIEDAGRSLWRTTPEAEWIDAQTINSRYDAHLKKRSRERREREGGADHAHAVANPLEVADDIGDEEIEQDWRARLIEAMKAMSPSAFERLAAALLRAAGFNDVMVTGQSGDGGIDGIGIYRPAGLVSFRTAFQCKRYAGSVGPSAVRDFRGSFVGQADRGIFITTGSFTTPAIEEAVRAGAPTVDLIDGGDLCDLLKQYKIGVNVQLRTVEDVTVSGEYFERLEEAAR